MSRSGGLPKFTLGMLIDLLRKINNVATNNNVHNKNLVKLKIQSLVSNNAIELFDKANALSNKIKHADESKINSLDFAFYDSFLSCIIEALNIIKIEKSYPKIIRVKKEIQDEYSRRYVIAVDDDGDELTIKSGKWLQSERAYFICSETDVVAISPIIIEKIF
jgi:hypothetical protein